MSLMRNWRISSCDSSSWARSCILSSAWIITKILFENNRGRSQGLLWDISMGHSSKQGGAQCSPNQEQGAPGCCRQDQESKPFGLSRAESAIWPKMHLFSTTRLHLLESLDWIPLRSWIIASAPFTRSTMSCKWRPAQRKQNWRLCGTSLKS